MPDADGAPTKISKGRALTQPARRNFESRVYIRPSIQRNLGTEMCISGKSGGNLPAAFLPTFLGSLRLIRSLILFLPSRSLDRLPHLTLSIRGERASERGASRSLLTWQRQASVRIAIVYAFFFVSTCRKFRWERCAHSYCLVERKFWLRMSKCSNYIVLYYRSRSPAASFFQRPASRCGDIFVMRAPRTASGPTHSSTIRAWEGAKARLTD